VRHHPTFFPTLLVSFYGAVQDRSLAKGGFTISFTVSTPGIALPLSKQFNTQNRSPHHFN
jgi:hypothetical protein